MSQDQSVVRSFREAWEQHFPDVPWVRDVFVPVATDVHAREFTFVFTGIEQFPLIDLVWREGGPVVTQSMNVNIERTDNGMGMKVTLEGFDSTWLHGFSLRQQGDRQFAALGCLQRDGETWKTIYNSKRRCDAFKEFLGEWFEQCGPQDQHEVAPLVKLASELAFGNVPEASRLIDQSSHAQALVKANDWLPAKFGLEYITHGLKRTFRFWGEKARGDSLREAVEIVQALRVVSEDACVFGGAVLGLEREGHLLPHDDDLDILIVVDRSRYPDLGTALERIAAVLERAGWPVVGYFFSHLWVKTRSSVARTLDVFVGIAEGDRISYYPLPRRALHKARMFPCVWRQLEGVEVPVPRDLVYYLESEYGPGWRVPDTDFRLTWDRRPYGDLAGNRSHPTLCTRSEQAFVALLATTETEPLME
jgi:hypothetical protein